MSESSLFGGSPFTTGGVDFGPNAPNVVGSVNNVVLVLSALVVIWLVYFPDADNKILNWFTQFGVGAMAGILAVRTAYGIYNGDALTDASNNPAVEFGALGAAAFFGVFMPMYNAK